MTPEVSAAEHGKSPIFTETQPRHVFVTLEMVCSTDLDELRTAKFWTRGADCVCLQAQANVSEVMEILTKKQAKAIRLKAAKARKARVAHAAEHAKARARLKA